MTLYDLYLFQYLKEKDAKLASQVESVYEATKDTIDAISGCYNNFTMHNTGHGLRVAAYMGELACGIDTYFIFHRKLMTVLLQRDLSIRIYD